MSAFHPSRLGPLPSALQSPSSSVLRSEAPTFLPSSSAEQELPGGRASSVQAEGAAERAGSAAPELPIGGLQ